MNKICIVFICMLLVAALLGGCARTLPDKKPNTESGSTSDAGIEQTPTRNESSEQSLTFAVLGSYSCELAQYLSVYSEMNPDVSFHFIENQHQHDENCDESHARQEQNAFVRETCERIKTGELQVDFILYDSLFTGEFVENGLFADMSQSVSIQAFVNNPNLLEGVARLCQYNGKIIGVPLSISYSGYMVNDSLLAAIGAEVPSTDWNYDDLYDIALALDTYNETAETKGYLFAPTHAEHQYINILRGLHHNEEAKPIINTPAFTDYMRKAKKIVEMGLCDYPSHTDHDHDHDHESDDAPRSDVLFTEVSYNDLHGYDAERFQNKHIIPIQTAAGNSPLASSVLIAMSAAPVHSALAESFIAGFLSEEYQYAHAFEMQLYADTEKYDMIATYDEGVKKWIQVATKHCVPLYLSREAWTWANTVELPRGNSDNIDFARWAESVQAEAELFFK